MDQIKDTQVVNLVKMVLKEQQAEATVFRDSRDVTMLRRQNLIIGFMCILIALLSILSYVMYLKTPDLLVAQVDSTGRKIVQINNRDFGETDAVVLGKDNLNVDDKKELINTLLNINTINQQSRESDINRALQCLIPKIRETFLKKELMENGQLAVEKQEMWSSSWETQSIDISDKGAGHSVARVIGLMHLTKIINGEPKKENIQYEYEFLLATNGSRENTPYRTGFFIADWQKKELSRVAS